MCLGTDLCRARSIERGHSAIWSAQESVRHIASVNEVAAMAPAGLRQRPVKQRCPGRGLCRRLEHQRREGAVRSAQEAVSYIARVNVASRDRLRRVDVAGEVPSPGPVPAPGMSR